VSPADRAGRVLHRPPPMRRAGRRRRWRHRVDRVRLRGQDGQASRRGRRCLPSLIWTPEAAASAPPSSPCPSWHSLAARVRWDVATALGPYRLHL